MRTSLLALMLGGCLIVPIDSRELDRQSVTLPVGEAIDVDMFTRAGSLEVIGVDGLDQIEMDVVLYRHSQSPWTGVDDQAAIDALVVDLTPNGTIIEADAFVDLTQRGDFSTDVTLRVPSYLAVTIDDTSGDITVDDVGPLTIRDGSGSIEASNVGALDIRDNSGDIRIDRILGDAMVNDDSGSIELSQVAGIVDIHDHSGDIRISEALDIFVRDDSGLIDARDIDGDADIHDDSGDIHVERVSGTVTIRDGSGSITAIDVGDLNVVSDGSGDITRR